MKKEHLLKHIQTYHNTKSYFLKKIPGDQNTYPRVSREIEKVIDFLNLIPGDSISDDEFKRLMVLIYQDKELSPRSKQTFQAMSWSIDAHHKALVSEALTTEIAAAAKIKELHTPPEQPDADIENKSAAGESVALAANQGDVRDVQAGTLLAALAKEFQEDEAQHEEVEDDDFNAHDEIEEDQEQDQEELEEDHDKRHEKEQAALNEEERLALEEHKRKESEAQASESTLLTHALLSEDEVDAATKLLPPAPPSTPNTSPGGGPLMRSVSSKAIDLLTAEVKADVAATDADSEVLSSNCDGHLIPPGSSATVTQSMLTNSANAETKPFATESTPLLSPSLTSAHSGPSRSPRPHSNWNSFKRATAFGLTMSVMDFANTHSSDERLNYRAMRALSIGFIYSVLSYNTENSSAFTLLASLFHSAINLYFNQPVTLYNAASGFFGRAAITTGSQMLWNRVLPDEQEQATTPRARAHR